MALEESKRVVLWLLMLWRKNAEVAFRRGEGRQREKEKRTVLRLHLFGSSKTA